MIVDSIIPEEKDLMRARHLKIKAKAKATDSVPYQGKADSMAKLITNPRKLVRRAKAIVSCWGTDNLVGTVNGIDIEVNMWTPFKTRLEELGFSSMQINNISSYEHDDIFEQLGLEDLLL